MTGLYVLLRIISTACTQPESKLRSQRYLWTPDKHTRINLIFENRQIALESATINSSFSFWIAKPGEHDKFGIGEFLRAEVTDGEGRREK